MRKSVIALAAASSVAIAAVSVPTAAEARWHGWWGPALGGFALGAIVAGTLARPYYGYGYYGYPAYSYYGYGYPAYYSYGYYRPRVRYYRRHYAHWR